MAQQKVDHSKRACISLLENKVPTDPQWAIFVMNKYAGKTPQDLDPEIDALIMNFQAKIPPKSQDYERLNFLLKQITM
jgi:hypothetical protein